MSKRKQLERLSPLSLAELMTAIGRINPTGLDLPAREIDRRYQEKSRLQSQLILRFFDQLEAQPEPGRPGLVLLRDPRGAFATHAILDQLDPDARAVLRRRLDEAEHVAPPPALAARIPTPAPASRVASPSGPPLRREDSDLLQAGLVAQAEYDYEAAEGLLRQAFVRSDGAPRPAVALLTLLVDHLVQDQQALDLVPALSAEAQAHPMVRLLLGLAAARTGDGARAYKLCADLAVPRAAEVLLLLCEAAQQAGDLREAGHLWDAARERDPVHPDLLRHKDAIAARRAAARAGEEQQLAALLSAGEVDAAERLAESILQRFPDSDVAGRALRERAEARRKERVAVLLQQADACVGDPALLLRARGLLAEALLLLPSGPARAELEVRLRGVDEQAQRRAEAARAAEVVRRLDDAAGVDEALRQYLDLPERVRELARGQAGRHRSELLRLEALHQAAQPRARAAAEACEALLALRRVESGGPGGPDREARSAAVIAREARSAAVIAREARDPQALLDLLLPHERLLQHLPEGRQQLRQWQEAVAAAARQRAQAQLAQARIALGELPPLQTLDLLGRIDERALDPAEHAERERLLSVVQATLRESRREMEYDLKLRHSSLSPARHLAEQYAAEDGDQAAWAGRAAELTARIEALFRVRVGREPTPPTPLSPFDELHIQLLPGGERVLEWSVAAGWLFVHLCELSGRVLTRAALRRSELRGQVAGAVCGEALVVSADDGQYVEWDLTDFRVRSYGGPCPPGYHGRDRQALAPDTRDLWLSFFSGWGGAQRGTLVVDLTWGSVRRRLPPMSKLYAMPTARQGVVVAVSDSGHDYGVYDGFGRVTFTERLPRGRRVVGCGVHPDGDGLLLLQEVSDHEVGETAQPGEPEPGEVYVSHYQPPCSTRVFARPLLQLDDRLDAKIQGWVTALSERTTFVMVGPEGGEKEILGLRADPQDGLSPAWRIEVPQEVEVLSDPASATAAVIVSTEGGWRGARLRREPPELSGLGALAVAWAHDLPRDVPVLTCRRESAQQHEFMLRAFGFREGRDAELALAEILKWPESTAENLLMVADDPAQVLFSVKRQLAVAAHMQAHYPDHPATRLARALKMMSRGHCAGASSVLPPELREQLYPEGRQHWDHIRAHALLGDGRLEEALAQLPQEIALWRSCETRGTRAMLEAWLGRPVTDPGRAPVSALVAAVVAGDDHLRAGDGPAAVRALDVGPVWAVSCPQLHARLAEAHLLCGERGDRFRCAEAVARYLQLKDERPLLLPERMWSAERLADVAERGRAWLEAW